MCNSGYITKNDNTHNVFLKLPIAFENHLRWLLASSNNSLRYYFYIRLQAVAKLELSWSHTSWAVSQRLGSAFEPWRAESCQSGAGAELSQAVATLVEMYFGVFLIRKWGTNKKFDRFRVLMMWSIFWWQVSFLRKKFPSAKFQKAPHLKMYFVFFSIRK